MCGQKLVNTELQTAQVRICARDEVVTGKECHHHQLFCMAIVAVSSFQKKKAKQLYVSSSTCLIDCLRVVDKVVPSVINISTPVSFNSENGECRNGGWEVEDEDSSRHHVNCHCSFLASPLSGGSCAIRDGGQ